MLLVGDGRKRRLWDPELVREPIPFVSSPSGSGIYFIVEVRLGDVQFAWVDSDDGAVFLMHSFDLEGVLPAAENIVVEFIPGSMLVRHSSKFAVSLGMFHQKVSAANLGPGNLDTGLKYRR